MPILHVYVDDDIMRRLRTFSEAECREGPTELAEAAVCEAAIRAVPLRNGKPENARFHAAWDANAL